VPLSYPELTLYVNNPAKTQRLIQIALNNSDRLVRLVNDILDLERLQSGRVTIVMKPCQVEPLMQQAVEGIQAIADQSSVTLSVTPLSATVWADPDAIVQTFTNLLSNAIKFSSTGNTVWFTAAMGEEPLSAPPTSSILFSIKDEGRGILADKLESIFERFQQVDIADSRRKGGTGLGLAICQNIVQQHHGRIWVESVLGEGSTFYFTLPLADDS
jgi:signal transduction histidine kinase